MKTTKKPSFAQAAKKSKTTKKKPAKTVRGRKSKSKANSWWTMPVSTFCLAVVLFAVCLAIRENNLYESFLRMKTAVMNQSFYDGVSIDGIDVSGHSLSEVSDFWDAQVEKQYREMSIVFEVQGTSFCLTAEELGYSSDYDAVIKRAWSAGRDGSLEERFRSLSQSRAGGDAYTVERSMYDPDTLKGITDSIAAKLTWDVQNAYVYSFDFDTREFTIGDSKAGSYVDGDRLYEEAAELIENGGGLLTVEVVTIEPEVTSKSLEGAFGLITTAKTSATSSSKARLNNLFLACQAINGTVVEPGETFSFNGTVGQRTKAKGYKVATVYQNGDLSEDVGGGVCQVSTTLWNAAMKCNCEIVERHEHSRPVSYVDKGKDATVSWGSQDMKFKNTGDYPLYIVAYLSEDKRVYVEIYGKLFPEGQYIAIESKITKTYPVPDATYVYNTALSKGEEVVVSEGRKGYRAEAYRVFYTADGTELTRELLCKSYYKEAAARIEYGG